MCDLKIEFNVAGEYMSAKEGSEDLNNILSDNTSGSVDLAVKVFSFLHRYPDENYSKIIQNSFVGMALVRNAAKLALSEPNLSPEDFRLHILAQERTAISNAIRSINAQVITTMSNSHNVKEFLSSSEANRIYVLESRPMLEGRIMAKSLSESGKDVYLITDAEMCLAVSKSDAVLVGSDSVLSDLALVHKVGTFPLAICARDLKKPFYSLTMSMKFEQGYEYKTYPEFVQHPCSELGYDGKCLNSYFEKTPADYVSAYFSDNGMIRGRR
ncbi:translation initiation factor eIF-2B, subunit delta related protein [Thermoplasma acidophilum]|uniref:Translation initiation factor eIF-2B, subunit delta related protein n=2 Tax=Thermoplasma acidophilum TaxID=2303 RepID=Q9HJQ7_THEAC|nr:translation initiation factor eIF-2B, subunit delta related protein [Thermoplasma acidophilum]